MDDPQTSDDPEELAVAQAFVRNGLEGLMRNTLKNFADNDRLPELAHDLVLFQEELKKQHPNLQYLSDIFAPPKTEEQVQPAANGQTIGYFDGPDAPFISEPLPGAKTTKNCPDAQ